MKKLLFIFLMCYLFSIGDAKIEQCIDFGGKYDYCSKWCNTMIAGGSGDQSNQWLGCGVQQNTPDGLPTYICKCAGCGTCPPSQMIISPNLMVRCVGGDTPFGEFRFDSFDMCVRVVGPSKSMQKKFLKVGSVCRTKDCVLGVGMRKRTGGLQCMAIYGLAEKPENIIYCGVHPADPIPSSDKEVIPCDRTPNSCVGQLYEPCYFYKGIQNKWGITEFQRIDGICDLTNIKNDGEVTMTAICRPYLSMEMAGGYYNPSHSNINKAAGTPYRFYSKFKWDIIVGGELKLCCAKREGIVGVETITEPVLNGHFATQCTPIRAQCTDYSLGSQELRDAYRYYKKPDPILSQNMFVWYAAPGEFIKNTAYPFTREYLTSIIQIQTCSVDGWVGSEPYKLSQKPITAGNCRFSWQWCSPEKSQCEEGMPFRERFSDMPEDGFACLEEVTSVRRLFRKLNSYRKNIFSSIYGFFFGNN